MALSVWHIHRRIGMSGGLLVNALLREIGRAVTPEEVKALQRRHALAYKRQVAQIRPVPGAQQLLTYLSRHRVPWAIATRVGLLSGGYGQEELEWAGAYRVYHNPADLLRHLNAERIAHREQICRLAGGSARRFCASRLLIFGHNRDTSALF